MSPSEAKKKETDQEQAEGTATPEKEYDYGAIPPEAEHTFGMRTLNSVEKPDFDGPSSPAATIEQAYRIEREGGKLSPEGLGHMAGSAVLFQYRAAKAEVGARWWQSGSFMFGSGLLTCTVPVVALLAGAAIDVAIFGGAAEELMKVSPWFKSLAAGSLVFAAGVGLSKTKSSKALLTGLLITASIGASMLAADNPSFKGHFANMLPQTLRSGVYAADRSVTEAQAEIEHLTKVLAGDVETLNHGGVNGQPILGDGYKGNDEQGHQLEMVTIPADKEALRKAQVAAAGLTANKRKADAESPASWWGQILGAAYLSAWLIASQLVVAKVIDSGATAFRNGRRDTARRRNKELFVDNLESSRGEASIKVAVGDMLHRYRDAMTNACKKNPVAQEVQTRMVEIDTLFSGEKLTTAVRTGTEMVKDAVHPRREKFEDYDKHNSGLMGKVVNLRQNPEKPVPSNKLDDEKPAP